MEVAECKTARILSIKKVGLRNKHPAMVPSLNKGKGKAFPTSSIQAAGDL